MLNKLPAVVNKWHARRKTVRRIYPERRTILRLKPDRRRRTGRRDEDMLEVSELEQHLKNALLKAEAHGPQDARLATALHNLAILYYRVGKYADAEPLYKRAMSIREAVFKPTHPHVIQSLNDLAALYYAQGRYVATESLLKRMMEIIESDRHEAHPMFPQALENYAELLRAQGHLQEAEKMAARAQDLLLAKRYLRSTAAPASQNPGDSQGHENPPAHEDAEDVDLAHPDAIASPGNANARE